MTEKEVQMYKLLGELASLNVPLVFKGGLVTELVLSESNYSRVLRSTVDIDANWIGDPPSMEYLAEILNNALEKAKLPYTAEPFREYGEKRSAGFKILDNETNTKVFSMDIEIKSVQASRTYHIGSMSFQGILPTEILADKISAASTPAIYKHRAKDLVDIYALAHCISVTANDIRDICQSRGKEISDFDGFCNHYSELEYAYNMLKRIAEKPPFDEIYRYTKSFLKPFVENDTRDLVWNTNGSWATFDKEKAVSNVREKPSIVRDE